MGFGLINNVSSNVGNGFSANRMFSGFNLGDGIKSTVTDFLTKEFKYTDIFSFLVRSKNALSTFDWLATDEEIRKQYQEINEELAGTWGAVIGRGIGSSLAV